jgi:hypothetical protein
MPKHRQTASYERDYTAEARELIRRLSNNELYDMHLMVINMQQRSQSDSRRKELEAVQKAIEGNRKLDEHRLKANVRGYRSTMAQDAKATDGNTTIHKKNA